MTWVGVSTFLALLFGGPASAFEFFDGRVQVHGFYEMQFRVINADFSEQWDVSQWYNVFNVEFELDLVQDTIGPLDLMQAYIRLEVRYDCVYSRGCGMLRSLNSWGDRAKNLPRRLSSGTKHITAGVIEFPDDPEDGARLSESLGRRVVPLENTAGLNQLAEVSKGGDDFLGVAGQNSECTGDVFRPKICKFFAAGEFAPPQLILDDPFKFTVKEFDDYRFTNLDMRNDQVAVLGPWLPKNIIYPNAVMANKSNPLDPDNNAFDKDTGEILQPLLFAVSYNGRLVHLLENRESRHGLSPLDRFLDQIEDSIDPFEEGTLPAATGWISRELGLRNIVSYDCPFNGPGAALPNGTASVSDCSINSNTVWKDELLAQGYSEALIDAGLASWDGFEGGGGNWVQLFIDHRARNGYNLNPDPDINPNPAAYISYDRPKEPFAQWSPFNNGNANNRTQPMGQFEPGALQFAEDSAYGGSLPLRPVGINQPTSQLGDVPHEATGAYYPSTGLRQVLDSGRLDPIPFNISESDRAFNRGYSQRQTKELKEAYLDIELFDSRLWLRVGKQTIVWGKTELFSFSDQFNPQDFALASLPSLEESRIPLWSLRGVYSLYSIGPLDDVRLEFAFNFDQNQPADLGACGEAYTVDAVCQLTFGLFAHGITGLGVVGVDRPPAPWESLKGWELGGRLEFRWDRFSFAIAEYYGYDDFPTIERVSNFERNIDPTTGLPRYYGTRDPCVGIQYLPRDSGASIGDEPGLPALDPIEYPAGVKTDGTGCLTPGPINRNDYFNTLAERAGTNALNHHFANQQLFTTACYATSGIAAAFDPGSCGLNVWNSLNDRNLSWHFAELLGHMFSGTYTGQQLFTPQTQRKPAFVRLSVDSQLASGGADQYWDASNRAWAPDAFPERNFESDCFDDAWALADNNLSYRDPRVNDNPFAAADVRAKNPYLVFNSRFGTNNGIDPNYSVYRPNCGEDSQNYMSFFGSVVGAPNGNGGTEEYGLSGRLTPEQEALLGCGPFMGTNCDVSGIDFMSADISILVQSWPGIDGTEKLPDGIDIWRTDDGRLIQPGTVDFRSWQSKDQPLRLVDPQKYFGYQTTQTLGAPRCTTNYLDDNRQAQPGSEHYVLPGCRGLLGPPTDPSIPLENLAGSPIARFRDETGYWHSTATMFFYPYREDGIYPQAECNMDNLSNPLCGNLGPNFQDLPEYHNQWEAGYDVRRDGNPLGVSSFFNMTDITLPTIYFNNFWCRSSVNRGDVPGGDPILYSLCVEDAQTTPGASPEGDAEIINSWGFVIGRLSDEGTRCQYPQDENKAECYRPNGNGRVNYAEEGEPPDYADEDKPWLFQGLATTGVGYVTATRNQAGDTGEETQGGLPQNGDDIGQHPFTGQVWQNELAAVSWNLLMLAAGGDGEFVKEDAYTAGICSWVTPQYCDSVRGLIGLAGLQHRNIEAGGNGTYGRRSMAWHAGGEILINYTKRNVLGFAVDFAEDYTKTNWSFDFTWIDKVKLFDATSRNNVTETDQYALTISVDRPTFINFLNPNHTFFINSQWFISYYPGWHYGVVNNGSWNVLGTVTALTGYFQDRLNAQATVVYDFKSNSGGVLPQVNYRVNQDFSITLGAAVWFGREQLTDDYINPIAPFVNSSYKQSTNQLISNIRNRDELFIRLRYTF